MNNLSLTQVADALDATKREMIAPGSPAPAEQFDPTLGLLLISALAANRSREHNRRLLDRVAARSSLEAHWYGAQLAAVESVDQWAGVPSALRLRGYSNREFGQDLSTEAVLRIRGRVCEVLDIDTAAADALPLCRVVEVLSTTGEHGGHAGDDLALRFRWLKVTEIARLFAMNAGQVSKLADAGRFVTNGKTGHDRRIDVLSEIPRELDRLNRDAAADESS